MCNTEVDLILSTIAVLGFLGIVWVSFRASEARMRRSGYCACGRHCP